MVPIPAEYMPDFWNELSSENPIVELSCLLPNGILVLLKVNYNASLAEIKEDLWDEASKYPMFGKLQTDTSQYLYKIVNFMAEIEELNDETRRLCDIRPTGGVLMVSECIPNSIDRSINVTIGHLIGKGLQEFEAYNSSEINDFRFNMKKMGEQIAKKRNQASWKEKLLYQFPPRISAISSVYLNELVNDYGSHGFHPPIRIEIKCDSEYGAIESDQSPEVLQSSFQFSVSRAIKPSKLLEMSLAKKAQILKINSEQGTEYVLKVCGRDEYLLLDRHLIEYQYIQDCIRDHATPSLLMVHTDRIPVVHGDYEYIDGCVLRGNTIDPIGSSNTLRKKKSNISSWNIMDNYLIRVNTASKVNCDTKRASEIGIQVGLFHGGKPLCQPVKTDELPVSEKCEVVFDVPIEFDIQVCNIPRNAKLCFVIYEVNKVSRGTKSRKPKDISKAESLMNPIAWANTSVYDFKGQLKTGAMTLYMWTYAEDVISDEVLHPLGTVVSNPNTEYSTALTVYFQSFRNDETIVYPCTRTILEFARTLEQEQVPETIDNDTRESCKRLITDVENFYDLHDQDRKKMWKYRHVWLRHMPEIFPRLLNCIDWDKREEVSQVIELLSQWPKLPVEKSLELLDYAYADQEVRKFAVKCLKDVSDEDLLLYLLQLVQAIKHELYLECELTKFLIERALTNQRVGHYLFWHLRSEMQMPAVSVKFGLILEAYCRGSQEHIPILQLQLKSVEKLRKCSEVVRSRRDKEKAKEALKECLSNNDEKYTVRSPLDPSFRCGPIRIEKCRVMDSKMKPLWILYEKYDRYGEDVSIIFKNGDDLRQDMLTLQMLKIMDRLWKREGYDLRMNPYNCISLDHRLGMIQVVLKSETIANIQKKSSISAYIRKDAIYAWLNECNRTDKSLAKAIEEFTFSCAGYCVATYVLGIADRHSDNIMIKETGQLFHIDFGHILGHFKEKFGIKRERVPFVLTHDFVYVINKGQNTTNALEFANFRMYCENAFMILRKHGNLILSLFAMMISTGLPELSSEKDLLYIRETLALSKTDEEALKHFKAKFDEALSNSWKTSLNWATHNISKNNKA
ncbi:phosphatidylinositol 4,5-bisphosphate 3-kinase catalytic subunit delta isoform isoform X1 [Euwallacea fornicatus]|uniref:phosphatidylinositol 4,5-bisphosphate 3-kinase catalytic subunit delta isoform isoform X1 n=1 Tax=Euwallacea fornicatus TaxID=995702 RepID=UPI00338EE027